MNVPMIGFRSVSPRVMRQAVTSRGSSTAQHHPGGVGASREERRRPAFWDVHDAPRGCGHGDRHELPGEANPEVEAVEHALAHVTEERIDANDVPLLDARVLLCELEGV